MGKPLRASCQYDDLRGSVAADLTEDELDLLARLAEVPSGFVTIGFQLWNPLTPENFDGSLPIHVLAVRTDSKSNFVQAMLEYGESKGEIPYYEFPARINLREFLSLFKRIDVKVVYSDLLDAPLEAQPSL